MQTLWCALLLWCLCVRASCKYPCACEISAARAAFNATHTYTVVGVVGRSDFYSQRKLSGILLLQPDCSRGRQGQVPSDGVLEVRSKLVQKQTALASARLTGAHRSGETTAADRAKA